MLRNLKFGLLIGTAILIVSAMATSAAYVTVNINRPASAKLTADNSANAAVRIVCLNNGVGNPDYSSLCTYDAAGSVTVALENALKPDGSIWFNRNASFTVGTSTANNRVVSITNNSQDPVTVYFDSTSANGSISMFAQDAKELTAVDAGTPVGDAIAPGTTREYYFALTTPDTNDATLDGQIQIR